MDRALPDPLPAASPLRAAFDPFPEALAILDAVRDAAGAIVDFEVAYVNRAVGELLGLPVEGMPGERLRAFGASRLFAGCARVVDDGVPLVTQAPFAGEWPGLGAISATFELRVGRLGDGVLVLARDADARIVCDGDGAPLPALGSSPDVIERREAERALAESEQRFRTAFRHAPIGVGILGADGVLVEVNDAYAHLLGRAAADLVGMHLSTLTHPEDWRTTEGRLGALYAGEIDHFRERKRLLRGDGREVPVEVTVTVFRDTDGAPRYTIGQVQPLADEQRAEAERGRRLREQAARTRAEALAAREQEIAELLQRSLLPGTMPALEHASVCSRYLPGAAGVEVGGDWYDVLGLPDGRIGVVIGDVAGRGVPAASIMGRLRSALRAYALEGEDPGTVLGRLNALEHSYPQPEMATVLYGIYAPSADTLHWASAGHLPVLVREASGDVRVPGTRQGFPIGAVPGAAYETCATPLHQGDIALLYTDGVAERRGEPLDAGLARLRGALRDAPDELDGLCKHVIATTRSDRSDDDVAVLALRAE